MSTKTVWLSENGTICEKTLELGMKSENLYNEIGGRTSFVGQYIDINVVVVKLLDSIGQEQNTHRLPKPLHKEIVHGPIVLIRIDDDGEPKNFTLDEWNNYLRNNFNI